jgi:hypothetical protein
MDKQIKTSYGSSLTIRDFYLFIHMGRPPHMSNLAARCQITNTRGGGLPKPKKQTQPPLRLKKQRSCDFENNAVAILQATQLRSPAQHRCAPPKINLPTEVNND